MSVLSNMLVAKVEELVAANERLSSELTAHQTLRAIYSDSSQPATVRVRAAQAALNVETPRLEPQPAPLELAAEEIEPLAVVVERRASEWTECKARTSKCCPMAGCCCSSPVATATTAAAISRALRVAKSSTGLHRRTSRSRPMSRHWPGA